MGSSHETVYNGYNNDILNLLFRSSRQYVINGHLRVDNNETTSLAQVHEMAIATRGPSS